MTNCDTNNNNYADLNSYERESLNETTIISETAPLPVPIDIGGCVEGQCFNAGDIEFNSLGRILQLSVTIKNVCPNKRVALACFLTETDTNKVEYKRGMKILTIPAQTSTACKDITIRCINFIIPEDLDASDGLKTSICNNRQFYVRVIAHYIDYDFDFCNEAN